MTAVDKISPWLRPAYERAVENKYPVNRWALVAVIQKHTKTSPIMVNVYPHPTKKQALADLRKTKADFDSYSKGITVLALRVRPLLDQEWFDRENLRINHVDIPEAPE